MAKTFREYLNYLGGYRIGNLDSFQPMSSLGDIPPKGKHAKELKKVYKNEKDANDYMAAIMIAKGG